MKVKSKEITPQMNAMDQLIRQLETSYHGLDHEMHKVENIIHERAMELNLE